MTALKTGALPLPPPLPLPLPEAEGGFQVLKRLRAEPVFFAASLFLLPPPELGPPIFLFLPLLLRQCYIRDEGRRSWGKRALITAAVDDAGSQQQGGMVGTYIRLGTTNVQNMGPLAHVVAKT